MIHEKKKRKGDKKMTSSVCSTQSYHGKHENDNQKYFQEYMYFFIGERAKSKNTRQPEELKVKLREF